MKRILTIQDISCVGKCSLTVALPIISACGVETSVIPTAVLSTHTAFKGFTFRDLTCDIEPIYSHWLKENIGFDALYSGYLGSKEQIDLVINLFSKFKTKDNFIIVDPAMGDNGMLYKGFDKAFAKNMLSLCKQADVVVPNITEACFMLDIPYVESGYNEDYVKNILIKLCDNGSNIAVLTGVCIDGKNLGVYSYNKLDNEFYSYYREKLPFSFHGTGDIFASVVCGIMAKGFDYKTALKIAVDFTVQSMQYTIENKDHNWYGVEFEKALYMLTDATK